MERERDWVGHGDGFGFEFEGVGSEVEVGDAELVEDSGVEDAARYSPAIPDAGSTLGRGYPARVGGTPGLDEGAGEPDRH